VQHETNTPRRVSAGALRADCVNLWDVFSFLEMIPALLSMKILQRVVLKLEQPFNEGNSFSFVVLSEEVDKCL